MTKYIIDANFYFGESYASTLDYIEFYFNSDELKKTENSKNSKRIG